MPVENITYVCINTGGYSNCTNTCVNTGGYNDCNNNCSDYWNYSDCKNTCVNYANYSDYWACTNVSNYNDNYNNGYTYTDSSSCYNVSGCYNCGNSGCNHQAVNCNGCCQSGGTVHHSEYLNSYTCTNTYVCTNTCVNTGGYNNCLNSCSHSGGYTNSTTCTHSGGYSDNWSCSNYTNYLDCTNVCTNYTNYTDYHNNFYYCMQGSHKNYNQCEDTTTYGEYANTVKGSCFQKYNYTYTGYTNATGFTTVSKDDILWGRSINKDLPSWNVEINNKIIKTAFNELQAKLNEINQTAKRPAAIEDIIPDIIDNSQFDTLKSNLELVSNTIKLNTVFAASYDAAASIDSVKEEDVLKPTEINKLKDEIQNLAHNSYYKNYFDCSDNNQFV